MTVKRILVRTGQQVRAGEVLMELDQEDLAQSIAQLKTDIGILELRLAQAAPGESAPGDAGVQAAQRALEDAQTDYQHLEARRARAGERAAEDLALAQEAEAQAQSELRRAEERARERLIQAAEDKCKAAGDSLSAVQEAARDAIEGAEDAVTAALDAQNSYRKGYYEAVEQTGRLKEQLSAAQAELWGLLDGGASEEAVRAAQERVDSLAAALESAKWSEPNYSYSADLAVRRAQDNVTKVTDRQNEKIAAAQAEVDRAQEELERTRAEPEIGDDSEVLAAQAALKSAGQGVRSARRALEDTAAETEAQLLAARRAVEQAEIALESAQAQAEDQRLTQARTQEESRRQNEIDAMGWRSERDTLRRRLASLEGAAALDGALAAPADGTVLSVLERPGQLQTAQTAAVLSQGDAGFRFRGSLSQEEAARLAEGDEGVLTFTQDGKSRSLDVTLDAPGAPDEKGQATVTALLPEGTYPTGAPARLEIARRSGQYPLCLPLSALRSDGDGDYVLALREEETAMGLVQTAVRVPVTVTDRDSDQMAVSGALSGSDAVITGSSRPVAEGDRVRRADGTE